MLPQPDTDCQTLKLTYGPYDNVNSGDLNIVQDRKVIKYLDKRYVHRQK